MIPGRAHEHIAPDVLSALIDGECGPSERHYVHEHLQECASCRRTMGEYAGVQRLVGGLERLAAPEGLVRAVLHPRRNAADAVRHVTRGPRRWVAAGVAAAAIGISVAGIAAPAEQEKPPVDVFVARHASVSAGNNVTGQVIFAVTGR